MADGPEALLGKAEIFREGAEARTIAGIPWEQMEKRTSPRIFKLIKDEILKLRDEWKEVLHTFKELGELLWWHLPDETRFTDDAWLFRPVGAWVSLGRSTQAAGLGWLVWRLWRADAQANGVA